MECTPQRTFLEKNLNYNYLMMKTKHFEPTGIIVATIPVFQFFFNHNQPLDGAVSFKMVLGTALSSVGAP